jgi:hypothetical protein
MLNRVWYVGLADSLRARLQVHDRVSDFKSNGATSIAWKPEENRAVRQAIEKDLIEFFHPPLNKQHNFNSLPEVDLGLTPEEEVERFLRLRIQLKLIEMELELLKPNIVTRCEQAYAQKIIHKLGTIRRQSYKRWQFSAEVESLTEKLKVTKRSEQENGKATVAGLTVSPVAVLNAAVLADEVAILVKDIEREMLGDVEDFPAAG